MRKRWFRPSLNWLLVFVPVGIGLAAARHFGVPWASSTVVFIASCLAIVPLAGWMGTATEHLAEKIGEGAGGLLNATFGNAAELIIAVLFLLDAVHHPARARYDQDIVKASLTGSIIGNILFVLGVSLVAGGLRRPIQRFNLTDARTGTAMLSLAAISLVVPAGFVMLRAGQPTARHITDVTLAISFLLLLLYGFYLLFSLRTHRDILAGVAHGAEAKEMTWTVARSITVLAVATAFVAVMSELLVNSVEEASHALGMSQLFIGVVIVAIIGNAAEHGTAVLMAAQNRMDLAIKIAVGSSTQIALFVAPIVALASFLIGQPMQLDFHASEVLAVVLSVAIVGQILGDGESNWLEGVQLLTVYGILCVLFYFLDNPARQ